MKYNIFYKEILIGVLEINEKGKYRYTPNVEGVDKVKNEISLIHEMLEASDWKEPIPFFKNRIDNAKRFSHENDITTHKDYFRMLMEND